MKMIKYLLTNSIRPVILVGTIIGFCISCAHLSIKVRDDRLKPYVEEFVKELEGTVSQKRADNFNVYFMSQEKDVIGRCTLFTRTITIDPDYWFRMNETKRRELMFHELAHCVCAMYHDNDRLKDNCPKSIMNEYSVSRKCLKKHWKRYILDLKKKCGG